MYILRRLCGEIPVLLAIADTHAGHSRFSGRAVLCEIAAGNEDLDLAVALQLR